MDGTRSAFAMLQVTLGESALRYLDKMTGAIHQTAVGTSDYSTHRQIVDDLMMAVVDRRTAFIEYHSLRSTEPVSNKVYALGTLWHRNSLYRAAWSVGHDETQHSLRCEDQEATRPPRV